MTAIDLNNHEKKKNENFLFDANIWLMNLSPRYNNKKKHKEYKLYLHDISFPQFCKKKQVVINKLDDKKKFYKENFRPSSEYRSSLNILLDDIKKYSTSYDLISDKLGDSLKSRHLLNKIPQELDFNDNLIYNVCKKNNFKLVTDDIDFKNQKIEILTLNNNYFI